MTATLMAPVLVEAVRTEHDQRPLKSADSFTYPRACRAGVPPESGSSPNFRSVQVTVAYAEHDVVLALSPTPPQ